MDRMKEAVLAQTKAMRTDLFEIGVLQKAQTEGEQGRMLLRTWDLDTLLHSLGWLRWNNAQGHDIYIRPAGEHPLSLVDDLSREAVAKMRATGYQPAAVVETSPRNYQAWLHHGKVLSPEVSTQAARDLAQRFGGDSKAADHRHFGRLAGFTNRKPKHQLPDGRFPFCNLVEATGVTYDQARNVTFDAQLKVETAARELRELRQRSATIQQPRRLKSIEEFRRDPRYGGDLHRVDQAYALYARSHGVSADDIAAAIRTRDLSKKGNHHRQEKYIENTLRKARGYGLEL
jgi:hypothetical protein